MSPVSQRRSIFSSYTKAHHELAWPARGHMAAEKGAQGQREGLLKTLVPSIHQAIAGGLFKKTLCWYLDSPVISW